MSKTVEYELTHGAQIVELKFITIPRKGWFAKEIQPTLAFLKAMIPASEREYNGGNFKWSFSIKYWDPIQALLKAQGFHVIKQSRFSQKSRVEVPKEYAESFYHEHTPTTSSAETTESIAQKLSTFLGVVISTQDLNDLKKLYRQKARELHPDLGGDATKMSELNRLWTLYCNTGVRQ